MKKLTKKEIDALMYIHFHGVSEWCSLYARTDTGSCSKCVFDVYGDCKLCYVDLNVKSKMQVDPSDNAAILLEDLEMQKNLEFIEKL